jgi:NADH-quinone oxidoreductase subunit K
MTLSIQHFLTLSAVLFSIGLFIVLTRKNAVALLMGVELMLNSVNVNLAAFQRFVHHDTTANIAVVANILIAACEAAAVLGIVISLYRTAGTVDVDRVRNLKG